MKHSLQIRQSRRLQLNAQLTQSLRLLQLGRVDLDFEIQNKLETNPLLEGVDSLNYADDPTPSPEEIIPPRIQQPFLQPPAGRVRRVIAVRPSSGRTGPPNRSPSCFRSCFRSNAPSRSIVASPGRRFAVPDPRRQFKLIRALARRPPGTLI